MSDKLIFDWNVQGGPELPPGRKYMLDDESLRDGLQSPSVQNPSIDDKIEILHLMDKLGIDSVNLGLPGAGPRAVEDVERLAREIVNSKLKIRPNCAARTHENDIRPIAEISERVGLPIEAATFLGSSPIRQYTEGWTEDFLLKTTEKAVTFTRELGLPSMYVTEDTVRANPATIKKLYKTAIDCGAEAIVLCDTVGHATPQGVTNLVRFVIEEVVKPSGAQVRVDWHGHRDRDLAVANSLAAFAAGADQVHGCALAIGERVGNTPMDLMLVNLRLAGVLDRDLSLLPEYCRKISEAMRVPIPNNYPVVGSDAFRTATGVHAAAVIKAFRKDDVTLANSVYSGVPSHLFGLEQVIEVGPMSGKSNIIFWLEKRGLKPEEELVDKIFAAAKQCDKVMGDEEILALCGSAASGRSG